MNKTQVGALASAVSSLRANGFESVTEAAIFSAAAIATANGTPLDVSAIARTVELPMSTVSRVAWSLAERGLLEYGPDVADRRRKVVSAKLAAFK